MIYCIIIYNYDLFMYDEVFDHNMLRIYACLDCTYLPSGFSKVLFELCGNGSVNVLAAGRITRYPIKYSRLLSLSRLTK